MRYDGKPTVHGRRWPKRVFCRWGVAWRGRCVQVVPHTIIVVLPSEWASHPNGGLCFQTIWAVTDSHVCGSLVFGGIHKWWRWAQDISTGYAKVNSSKICRVRFPVKPPRFLSTAWEVLRKHPIRSGVRCGIYDAWGSNCASVGCRPGFASREDTDSRGYQHSDSTRFPRNSVGKRRRDSGRTGPNRRWSTCVPMRGHMPVGLELHAPWWRLRARSSGGPKPRSGGAWSISLQDVNELAGADITTADCSRL